MDPVSAGISTCISLAKLADRVIEDERQLAELRRIINELGEQQVNNALRALRNARISSDPRSELYNAVNHLQDAQSIFQQAYLNADYSRRQKLTRAVSGGWDNRAFEEPDDDHPRYERGKNICYTDVIIATIYVILGEREVARGYAEDLRNDADKAYPSVFHIEALVSPRNVPSLGPDRDLAYWFSAKSSQSLEEAFSFFESVNAFLRQVGANPFTAPQLTVHVRRFDKNIWNEKRQPLPTYDKWKFMVSGRRDLVMQCGKALPAG